MPFGSPEGVQGVLFNRKTVLLDTIETLQAIGGAVMGLKQHQILILGKKNVINRFDPLLLTSHQHIDV